MRNHLAVGFIMGLFVLVLLANTTESQVAWSYNVTRAIHVPFGEYKVDNFTAALWHFNEGSGNIAYDETGVNNGTIVGASWTKGKFKKALDFDGLNDYVIVPDDDSLDLTSQGTLEAWVKPYTLGQGWFIAKATGSGYNTFSYVFRFTDGGPGGNPDTLAIIIDNNGAQQQISGNIPLKANKFQHIAVTWNGSTVNLYVNGVLDVSVPQTVLPAADTEPLYIGGQQSLYDSFFDGVIDEVRISDKTRNPTEFNV